MYERTKSHPVPERSGHVGDGHVSVALTVQLTPLLQSLDGSHAPGAAQAAHTTRATGGGLGVREPEERERQKNKVSAQGLTVNCGAAAAASCFLLSPE